MEHKICYESNKKFLNIDEKKKFFDSKYPIIILSKSMLLTLQSNKEKIWAGEESSLTKNINLQTKHLLLVMFGEDFEQFILNKPGVNLILKKIQKNIWGKDTADKFFDIYLSAIYTGVTSLYTYKEALGKSLRALLNN